MRDMWKQLRARMGDAGPVLVALLVCLGSWLMLAAPRLERAAEAAPDGMRRTVSLAVLEPIAWVSRSLGISRVTETFESAVGRDPDEDPGGEIDIDDELAQIDLPEIPPERPQPPRPSPTAPAAGQKDASDDPLRTPTSRYKLRVAVVGDSLADGVGDAIARNLDRSLVHVLSLGKIATGLARADYFDWVDAVRKVEARYSPDVLVVMVGSNDKQSVVFPGGRTVISGDDAWGSAYKERIDDLLAAARSKTHVAWIGLPPVRDRGKSELFEDYNDMYADVVKERRNSLYLDIWERFAGNDGRYRPYGPGPDGSTTLLREGDGSHFTAAGYDLIVEDLVAALRSRWDLTGKVAD